VLVADDDMFGIPFVVLNMHLLYVIDPIEASRSAPIGVGIVHLNLIAFGRPAFILVGGVKINPGVRSRRSHYTDLEFEIFEIMVHDRTLVEKMGTGTRYLDGAVFDAEGCRVFTRFPAIQGFPVKETDPFARSFRVVLRAVFAGTHGTGSQNGRR